MYIYMVIIKFINVSSPHIITTFWWLVYLKSALLIPYLSLPLWLISLSTVSFFLIYLFKWRLITLQHCGGFCHTWSWISHGCTNVPSPEPPSHHPPHPIPLGCLRAPALRALLHASNLLWPSISHMVIYMLQCYFLKSSHPHLLPQSPKVCSLHLCVFWCLANKIIVTVFLNSIRMS